MLIVDARYFPDELTELRATAGRSGLRLLATHSHYDHLMGRLVFPDAPLLVAESTAAALAEEPDRPARELAEEDARTYVRRDRPLGADGVTALQVPGRLALGQENLELIATPGHTGDGLAVWWERETLLCCGDYLSDVEIPLLSRAGSLPDYRATLRRLESLVNRASRVVPGHGSPTDRAGALKRLQEDVAYLDAIERDDPDQPLPPGRDTPRQREIHRANLERHGPGRMGA